MSKLNIFIDGSWLYRVAEGEVFDRFLCNPEYFDIDFKRLNLLLLKEVQKSRPDCHEIGKCYFVTSIFELPANFDSWEGRKIIHPQDSNIFVVIEKKYIKSLKDSVANRKKYADGAISAGYDQECILKVDLQDWMLLNYIHPALRYKEKQVDTTLVALFVKEAILNKEDCFALVAGDADILPAISVVYPSFTKNIIPVFTSKDEKEYRNKQTSYKYSQFKFGIPAIVLQNFVKDIMKGNVYQCTDCHRFFTRLSPIPQYKLDSGSTLPRCDHCRVAK